MIVRKTLLVASAAALMSTPAWATSSDHGKGHSGPPATTPDNHGATHHSSNGTSHGKSGHSRRCQPHGVGYVASGTLVSQTLAKNEDGTYSGEVSIKVVNANHHASQEKGGTLTLKVQNVHVVFGLADTNSDGTVGLDDVKEGDRVTLIGKITSLAKKCDHKGFTPKLTVRQVVVNSPASGSSS